MYAISSMRFRCGRCGAGLKVASERAGFRGPCPVCGGEVAAPQRPEGTPTVKDASAVEPMPAAAWRRVGLWTLVGLALFAGAVTFLVARPSRSQHAAAHPGIEDSVPESLARVTASVTQSVPPVAPSEPKGGTTPQAGGASPRTPALVAASPRPRAAAVRSAVENGLVLKGAVTFDTRTQFGYNSQTTIHQWKLGLSLEVLE